ncbi:MAG: PD-(D/E)XK nuclease family protein [bacterium]|nr:PD-(D/E)XK nuclease family protein [bacterium]
MKNGLLISPSSDIIEIIGNIILEKRETLSKNLIVFPGKRPSHFLRKYLADNLKSSFEAPAIFSIDEFIDYIYELSGKTKRRINEIDAIAIIFDLHKKYNFIGEKETLNIDNFLSWGFKLYSDFEEMYMESIKPSNLKETELIAGEKIPTNIYEKLSSLSSLYGDFYKYLDEQSLSTGASRYREVAETIKGASLDQFEKVIFAGFFMLNNSEKKIFEALKKKGNVIFIFQKGSGIESTIATLNIEIEEETKKEEKPNIYFYPAMDVHGEVFALNRLINVNKEFTSKNVIVLPSADSLFPVVQYTLPFATGGYNISMGYPLFRTPVYSLIETLGKLLETRVDKEYFIPDYLGFILHPYIKNIYLSNANLPTRIMFHTIEEYLVEQSRKFISLEEIEEDKELLQECFEKLNDYSIEEIQKHLKKIHEISIKAFEKINSIEDFSEKLLCLISFIANNSPAKMHPYTGPFIKRIIEGIYELKTSLLKDEKFEETKSYFRLLRTYSRKIRYPFEGTPVNGLQVLGFLETRNIKFETVYILDANEGVLPDVKKEDTLLPYKVRKYLGLSTYEERERRDKYNFERLVSSAKDVHIFYIESADKGKSRFVEKLIWELQKGRKTLELDNIEKIFFGVQFNQKEPEPIKKNEEMIKYLQNFKFSPTSLDAYLHCQLKFYYNYVLRLSEKEEIGDKIEQSEIGTIVHDALKEFFTLKIGQKLYIDTKDYVLIEKIVEKLFEESYAGAIEGDIYLIKLQVQRRIKDILNYHNANLSDVIIKECENELEANICLLNNQEVRLRGRVDRIDDRNGEIHILDYKTGSTAHFPSDKNFPDSSREEWYKTLNSVQLPFYIMLYLEKNKGFPVDKINSSLMLFGTKVIKEMPLFKDGVSRDVLFNKYKEAILTLLEEILSKNIEFKSTKDFEKECVWCSYKNICGTQWVTKSW